MDFLHNNCDKDYIIEKSSHDTRNYAKRQITWINNKLNKGFKVFESVLETSALFIKYLSSKLCNLIFLRRTFRALGALSSMGEGDKEFFLAAV